MSLLLTSHWCLPVHVPGPVCHPPPSHPSFTSTPLRFPAGYYCLSTHVCVVGAGREKLYLHVYISNLSWQVVGGAAAFSSTSSKWVIFLSHEKHVWHVPTSSPHIQERKKSYRQGLSQRGRAAVLFHCIHFQCLLCAASATSGLPGPAAAGGLLTCSFVAPCVCTYLRSCVYLC